MVASPREKSTKFAPDPGCQTSVLLEQDAGLSLGFQPPPVKVEAIAKKAAGGDSQRGVAPAGLPNGTAALCFAGSYNIWEEPQPK